MRLPTSGYRFDHATWVLCAAAMIVLAGCKEQKQAALPNLSKQSLNSTLEGRTLITTGGLSSDYCVEFSANPGQCTVYKKNQRNGDIDISSGACSFNIRNLYFELECSTSSGQACEGSLNTVFNGNSDVPIGAQTTEFISDEQITAVTNANSCSSAGFTSSSFDGNQTQSNAPSPFPDEDEDEDNRRNEDEDEDEDEDNRSSSQSRNRCSQDKVDMDEVCDDRDEEERAECWFKRADVLIEKRDTEYCIDAESSLSRAFVGEKEDGDLKSSGRDNDFEVNITSRPSSSVTKLRVEIEGDAEISLLYEDYPWEERDYDAKFDTKVDFYEKGYCKCAFDD